MMANVPPEAMAGISPEMVENMPPDVMSVMSPDMMANMPPEAMAGMDADMIANIPPEAMAGISPEMVENMPPEAMSSMSPEMMQNIPPEAQNAVSEASDGGLGALDEAFNQPPVDISIPDAASDALSEAVNAVQTQGSVNQIETETKDETEGNNEEEVTVTPNEDIV